MNIYSIHDSQIDAFSQPFFSPTNGSALRAFADHVNEAGTPANKHAKDFTLWHLGTFNETTGELNQDKPTRIGTALEYLQRKEA